MGWKVHALIHHLPTWFAEALYSEQTTEAVHSKIKPTLVLLCKYCTQATWKAAEKSNNLLFKQQNLVLLCLSDLFNIFISINRFAIILW